MTILSELKMSGLIVLVGLLMFLSSCSFIDVEKQAAWNDPQYQGGPMRGILVILISQDLLQKRAFEDEFGKILQQKGIVAEAGYRVIPNDEHMNEAFIRSCIIGSKAEAILVNKIMGVKKETNVIPGYVLSDIDRNVGFSRYYSRSFRTGHYVPSTTVEVENIYVDSRLYRCDTEGLIWQQQTKIVNVKPFEGVVKRLAGVIIRDLTRKDLL